MLEKNGKKYAYPGVPGGGCSGFQYEWDMTDTNQRGTLIHDILVLDMTAEMFVIGCTVDWVNEFGGSYLKVVNQMLLHNVVVAKVLQFKKS